MPTLEATLMENLDMLLGYTRKKVGDPELAADVLQTSLLKGLEHAPALRDDARLLPWFYRILNNTIADLYRRRQVEAKYRPTLARIEEAILTREEETSLCTCVNALLPSMKPEYAELIVALDLREEDPQTLADRLGITRNNLKVRHHRARRQLRERLEETCRTCADHGCLDCSCKHP